MQTLTQKTLDEILSKTRFSDDMRNALRLVIVDGKSPAEASALTGVSQTKLYVRRKQLDDLLAQANLRQITFIYPTTLQTDVDKLKVKIDRAIERLRAAEDPSVRAPAPKVTPAKSRARAPAKKAKAK